MSEREINERRNWKAQTFPYDHYIGESGEECLYCLTEKQAEILRGIIEPLAWSTRWWSDTGTPIDQSEIQAFRDDITRRLMMGCGCDDTVKLYRYSSTGILQISVDNGVTWTDAPEEDTRNNSTQFPPIPESGEIDERCIAATGAVALIKDQVGDQLTGDMTRYTINQLITDWVGTMIRTSNPFQALLTVIANQIFALVISSLITALTETVYDQLLCIFYCRMFDDGHVNDNRWSLIRSDISEQIGGIAGIFLEHLIFLLGVVGTTNLIRAGGASTGDCSDCEDCPQPARVFALNAAGSYPEIMPNEIGQYEITAEYLTGGKYYTEIIFNPSWPTDPASFCNEIEITVDSPDREIYGQVLRCSDGLPDSLSHCNRLYQFRGNVPFTITVRLINEYPCTP